MNNPTLKSIREPYFIGRGLGDSDSQWIMTLVRQINENGGELDKGISKTKLRDMITTLLRINTENVEKHAAEVSKLHGELDRCEKLMSKFNLLRDRNIND